MEKIKMEEGKIYYLSYGGAELVGRFKCEDVCNYIFYAYIHYWAGREDFRQGEPYCVKSGLQEIRRATQTEKMALLRFEIEHETI